MAIIKPFKALRPREDLVERVASLPYDVMSRKEAKRMAMDNPYSFLHVVRSEIDYPSSVDAYDPKVYKKAQKNLKMFEDDGILIQDENEHIYIYRQTMNGKVQTGFVACTSVDDYVNGVIKRHETTLLSKEKDRINHFDRCDANTAPIFLTYRDRDRLNEVMDEWTDKHDPEFDILTDDGVGHAAWLIDDDDLLLEISELFGDVDSLYIADGHHRAASAAKVALKRRQENPNYTGDEEFNFFMSVIFPESNLTIMDYNRVVHDLNGMTEEAFIDELDKLFIIQKSKAPYKPMKKHMFGMYLNKQWYSLKLRDGIVDENDALASIDAAIMEEHILNNLLSIKNVRNSSRISFVGGIRGLKGLRELSDELDGVGFSMYPATMQDIMAVSDAGLIMPAKSTWFEPKLRSGLFVHKFNSFESAQDEDSVISLETEKYIEKVLEKVRQKDGHETEFVQAVTEVLHSLGPVLEQHPEYIENNILERIVEPERIIMFRVPWVDDEGMTHVNRGFRVQFNGVIGPYKGGLRFHESVYLGMIKFLGFEQIFKNSLTSLPIGGGKGGSDFHPLGKSDEEIRRFCESFMTELYRHIGPNIDVPAGDVGVGAREIGYLFGHYRRIRGAFENGVLTGKGLEYGGSLIRPEATGYGATYFAYQMLKHDDLDFKNKTVAVSGFGNVAWGVCKKVTALGGKVVTLSGPEGYIYDPDGVNTQEKFSFMLEMRASTNGKIEDYADRFDVEFFEGKKPWEREVDIIMPCATQNEIYPEDAKQIIANGVRYIVEGANMPTTNESIKLLKDAGVLIGPGKAANAGGVATSALEMSQNSMRLHWTSDEVDEKLRGIMKNIYNSCVRASSRYGFGYDLIAGANIAGFTKVADAMIKQGKY
ncbi:MAG: NADP-specific glutamate dehydrogenase [Candidatus Izimaplasma sp.]|nr:NADP-specific glutamate dehydrogenase [Candidatus Izimaplasma bacterium]